MNNIFFAGNFLFRKIFSYISLGPVYINELFLFYRAFAYLITLKFRVIHIFPISLALYGSAHLLSLFIQGASIDSTALKNLPVMLYAIFSLTIFKLGARNVLILVFSLFIIESFLILLYGSAIGITLFGDVVYPHNSAIHAAATVYFLFRFIDKNDYRILIFFLISFLFLVIEGQRAGFVNLGFCLLIIFLFTFTYRSIFTFFSIAGVVFIVMLISSPAILEFFMSFIPGTEASRSVEYLSTNSRIEQWSEVISNVTKLLDFNTIMFGLGINFEIIQEGWRNPHNGYLSIIGRYGLFGLFLFLLFIFVCIIRLRKFLNENNVESWFLPILFLSFLSDGLTQTSLDSPFTLVLFYLSASTLINYNGSSLK